MDFTELELVLRAGRFGWACLHPCERSVSKSYVWRGGYFLENSSQPPIWNSQMSRTFENSSKPKNQIAFFKCILNWVLRQKNSNNLWRCRVSLTGLIPENVVKICISQSNLSTWIEKKPELLFYISIYYADVASVCLFVFHVLSSCQFIYYAYVASHVATCSALDWKTIA